MSAYASANLIYMANIRAKYKPRFVCPSWAGGGGVVSACCSQFVSMINSSESAQ